MDQTPNLNLPIPNENAVPPTNISAEFPRIALALTMLDAIIHTLQGVVAGKANTEHSQAISTITGLTEALAAKMPANATFSLDSLTDVQGAADALVNYVLVKKPTGQWEPSTALAALGIHNHAISEIVGLGETLVDIGNALSALVSDKADKSRTVTGTGLASGGGDLSANRVITVSKATDVESKARSRDDVAITPKGVGIAALAVSGFEMIGDPIDLVGQTSISWNNLSAYRELLLDFYCIPGTDGASVYGQVSTDNGSTWLSSAGDYGASRTSQAGATITGAASNFSFLPFNFALQVGNVVAEEGLQAIFRLKNFNKATRLFARNEVSYYDTGGNLVNEISSSLTYSKVARNGFRVFASTGNLAQGYAVLWGLKG